MAFSPVSQCRCVDRPHLDCGQPPHWGLQRYSVTGPTRQKGRSSKQEEELQARRGTPSKKRNKVPNEVVTRVWNSESVSCGAELRHRIHRMSATPQRRLLSQLS